MKPLHLRSMLSRLMSCTANCNTCSQHWSTERAQSSPQWLTTHCTTRASKVEQIGLWNFAPSAIFTWPLANLLPLFQASQQLFAEEMLPQPAGGRNIPRVCQISKHGFLHCRNKLTYFLIGKSVLIVLVPVLINKHVFEPGCNDLKFTVQNHS